MKKIFLAAGFSVLFSCAHQTESQNRTVASECSDLVESISQMIEAQDSIQKSLIDNHQVMADNMSDFADTLKSSNGRGYKEVSQSLYKASESVKKRRDKAKDISKKFSEKSEDVLKTVKKCLK